MSDDPPTRRVRSPEQKEARRLSCAQNREKERARRQRWRLKNREKNALQNRKHQQTYKEAHPERVKEAWKREYDKDPERLKARWRRQKKKERRARQREVVAEVYRAIPETYPKDVRDEIAAEMLVAHSSKRLARKDIRLQAPMFVKAYWRANDQFKTRSLDAPIVGTNGATLLDTLAAPCVDTTIAGLRTIERERGSG